jgi:hypothetical protein
VDNTSCIEEAPRLALLSRAQSLSLTPKALSFLAYESLLLAAFAAVATAASIAWGPLCSTVLIKLNLWEASTYACVKVAMSSA